MPRLFEAAKAQRGSGMDSGKEKGEDLLLSYEPMKEDEMLKLEEKEEGKAGEKAKREVCDGF